MLPLFVFREKWGYFMNMGYEAFIRFTQAGSVFYK